MTKFGKSAPSGQVDTESTECILTGRELKAPFDNTTAQRITGTPFFYRVIGSQYHRVTPAHMDYWAAHAGDEAMPLLDNDGVPIAPVEAKPIVQVAPIVRSSRTPEKKNEVAE